MSRQKLVSTQYTCGSCGLEKHKEFKKHRVYMHKPSGKPMRSSVYMDLSGREWKGTICPDCVNNVSRLETLNKKQKTKRKCNQCHKALPAGRWFNHVDCSLEALENYDGVYLAERYTSSGWGY